jgi:hypothetical protein
MVKSPDSFKFLTPKSGPMDIHDRCKGRTTRDISTRVTSLVKPFGSFAAGWQVAAQFGSSHKSPYAGRKGP